MLFATAYPIDGSAGPMLQTAPVLGAAQSFAVLVDADDVTIRRGGGRVK